MGRVRRARMIASVAVGFALAFFAPEYGWWTLALFGLSGINMLTLDARSRRSARPEYHVAFSVVWTQAILAAAIALSGGPRSFAMPWIVIPTAVAAARFRARVVMAGIGTGLVLMLAAALGVNAHETLVHPDQLLVATALLAAVTATVFALSGAEIEHRGQSTLDPLTGLLNRTALERRFQELADQARLTGDPVSVLVCDIDRFKHINDEHGHSRGDAVLRDVGYELRKHLRSFELIYRMGGEEFLVVFPGADETAAGRLAEQLRTAIEQARPGGVDITLSVGLACARGQAVGFERLYDAADAALYEAKSAGRNRVVSAGRELAAA
ncbi:MAG: GGDEF domain-containing protein [Actinobacteria bacterium]|nr:GGDEF domain-containing protein [Actinomycetota bacterium]